MSITNAKLQNYAFLQGMYDDSYFPSFLVDKGKQILINLCKKIETQNPTDSDGVYKLTHAATEEFNNLSEEFEENDSEMETVAREVIAENFDFIIKAYGFDLDIEEVIAPRDW